jgi:hypothetical protein
MVTMLAALGCLSTPLAAQGGALALGLAFTVGSSWQIEALDAGYAWRVHAGPIAAMSLTGRLGSFIDEGAIVGGARGVVFGTSLAVRTPSHTIAELGADTAASRVAVDLTVEATGYAGSNSPLPVGSPWGGVSGLVGLRFGDPNGGRFGLVFGPTVFFGAVTQTRAFLGIRFETPLAGRERHP